MPTIVEALSKGIDWLNKKPFNNDFRTGVKLFRSYFSGMGDIEISYALYYLQTFPTTNFKYKDIRPQFISKTLKISCATVDASIKRLLSNGLIQKVERRADERNEIIMAYSLTKKGLKVMNILNDNYLEDAIREIGSSFKK